VLPLRDRNPTSRRPWVTLALIAANVVVFLAWQPSFDSTIEQDGFYFCNALIPYEVTHGTNLADGGFRAREAISNDFGDPRAGPAVQALVRRECPGKSPFLALLISMFLHAGWLHLAGNLLFLWVFGNNVEDRLGHATYLGFYVVGGLGASGLQIAFGANSTIPNVGASGAIAAILGAYLVMFPRARVLTLLFVALIELPAAVVLGLWFVLQFFSGVGSLTSGVEGGVAYWAHVGGFVAGLLAAKLLGPRRAPPPSRILPPRPDWGV
jgi:membrane associated rhomboid family serine protease